MAADDDSDAGVGRESRRGRQIETALQVAGSTQRSLAARFKALRATWRGRSSDECSRVEPQRGAASPEYLVRVFVAGVEYLKYSSRVFEFRRGWGWVGIF